MREIKFRAWHIKDKKWHYFNIPYSCWIGTRYENWTEYTGLKDCNGVEIYEGDIVGGVQDKYEVKFNDGYYFCENENDLGFALDKVSISNHAVEVIGNIYENPELLTN